MTRIELTYRIHLLTSLHIGTGIGFAKMVDDTVIRAGPAKGDGVRLPCISGSSIKGKVRSRCEALANTLGLTICGEGNEEDADTLNLRVPGKRKCKRNPCIICRLFGSPYVAGHLHYSDALLVKEWRYVGKALGKDPRNQTGSTDPFALATVRAGNKLERATRTVEPDFLFSLEYTPDNLKYEGTIAGQVDARTIAGLNEPLPLEGWFLVFGLQAVDKIGGLRSRGLGRCRITVTRLVVGDKTDLTGDLNNLLASEDYWLGVSEYNER